MQRKRLSRGGRGFAAFAGLTLLVTACGGDEPNEESTEAEATDAADTAAEDEAEPEDEAENSAEGGGEAAPADHFEGETIELVHGFSIGGGYDLYARLVAEEMSEELGTDVIVVHEPGAGGLLATNQTWAAEPDGTRITLINASAVVGAELAEGQGVQYEAADFGWIGRISSEPNVAVVRADHPTISSAEDLMNASEPVRFAATGAGSVEYIDPVFLREAFGMNIELVGGFAGGPEAFASVLAGDVDAQVRTMGSQLGPIEAGDAVPVLIIGSEAPPELPDVMTIFDLASDADTAILEQHAALTEMGRALVAPPGMDPAVLQLLRDTYETVATDPDVMAAAAEQGRPLSFMSGAEQEQVVQDILGAPDAYVSVLREAFSAES